MSRQGSARYYHKSRDEFILDKATAAEDNDDQLIEISYEQWMKITGALVSSGLAPVATGLNQMGSAIYAVHQSTQTMVGGLNSQIGAAAPHVVSTFKYIGAVLTSFYLLYMLPFFQSIGASISPLFQSLGASIAQGWDALMVSLFETESRPWAEKLAPLIDGWQVFSSACVNGWTALRVAAEPMLASLIQYIGEELQKESAQSKMIKEYAEYIGEELQKESEQGKMIKKYARDSYASTQEGLINLWEDFQKTGIQSKIATTAVGFWYVLFGFMNLIAPEISLAAAGYTPMLSNDPAVSAVRKTAVIDILVGAICWAAAQRDTPVLYEILATINVVIGGSDVVMVVLGLAPPLNMLTAVAELLGAAWITWAVKRDQALNRNVPATRAQRITQNASRTKRSAKKNKTSSNRRRADSKSTTASGRQRSRSGKSANQSRPKRASKRSQVVSPRRSVTSNKSTKSGRPGSKCARPGRKSGTTPTRQSGRSSSKSVRSTGGGMLSNGMSL